MATPKPNAAPLTLAELIAQATGTSVLHCYQCGRCAAGCPQNQPGAMEISPTRVMRLLQLEAAFADDPARADGFARRALQSPTPWLCLGCQACTTRCPQGVDIAGVMDVLREQALQRGLAAKDRRSGDIRTFHQQFLAKALRRGRIEELPLILRYKLARGHWRQDAALGPAMLRRGKLKLKNSHSADTRQVLKAIDDLRRSPRGGP